MIQKQVSHRGFHLLDKTIDSLLLGMDLGPVDVERTLGALALQNPQSQLLDESLLLDACGLRHRSDQIASRVRHQIDAILDATRSGQRA